METHLKKAKGSSMLTLYSNGLFDSFISAQLLLLTFPLQKINERPFK